MKRYFFNNPSRHLIDNNYIEIYNTSLSESLKTATSKSCEMPMKVVREYIQKKIRLFDITWNSRQIQTDKELDLSKQIVTPELHDLILLTQYLDKMIDGPKNCLPSKCIVLKNEDPQKTTIQCELNYKIQNADGFNNDPN